jgi:hypothetical protein
MNDKTSPALTDIRRDFERVSADVVKKASAYAASILADVAGAAARSTRASSPSRARCAWPAPRSPSR